MMTVTEVGFYYRRLQALHNDDLRELVRIDMDEHEYMFGEYLRESTVRAKRLGAVIGLGATLLSAWALMLATAT